MKAGGSIFNGRRIEQKQDYSLHVHMGDYIDRKLKEITMSKKKKGRGGLALPEAEKEVFRATLMKVMWAARTARPDVQGSVAALSRRVPQATYADLEELQKLVHHLKKNPTLGFHPTSLAPSETCLVVIADSSPSTSSDLHPQAGYIVGFTSDKLNAGLVAPLNIIAWRSGKVDRVCASSLAAEAYGLVAGVACGEYIMQSFLELTHGDYHPTWSRQRLMMWEQGTARHPDGSIILRHSLDETLKRHLVITDAKSLYDSLRGQAKGKEPRVAIAIGEIKQGMAMLGLRARWIPHNHMLCDPLTKSFLKNNATLLLSTMKSGCH